MATEILRSRAQTPASGAQTLSDSIARAAQTQEAAKINQAIQVFGWVRGNSREEVSLPAISSDATAGAAHVEPPGEYFASAVRAGVGKQSSGSIVSGEALLPALKCDMAGLQKGIAGFLQSGIPEALKGLKLNPARSPGSSALEPLDELLAPARLKNLDASQVRASFQAINEMFNLLKSLQSSASDLQVNRMRMLRA